FLSRPPSRGTLPRRNREHPDARRLQPSHGGARQPLAGVVGHDRDDRHRELRVRDHGRSLLLPSHHREPMAAGTDRSARPGSRHDQRRRAADLGGAAMALDRAGQRRDLRMVRWMLGVNLIFGTTFLVVRMFEFRALHCLWNSHAYGSITWTLLSLHTTNLVTSLLETAIVLGYFLCRPVDGYYY